MVVGRLNNITQRIPILKPCNGYYVRWWYNGWHYWFFIPGTYGVQTEGLQFRTITTRKIVMGTGQVTLSQAMAIRSILLTREVYVLSAEGWMNVLIDPTAVKMHDNKLGGCEMEFTMYMGSKELSYASGFTPVNDIPEDVFQYCDWYLPSADDWQLVYSNLYSNGLANFGYLNTFWASNEIDATHARIVQFQLTYLIEGSQLKTTNLRFRAVREFTSTNIYNLGETGPGGGYIYYINGNTYREITKENIGTDNWTNAILICDAYCTDVYTLPSYCELTIGTQTWMCENWSTNFPGSVPYANDDANIPLFGRLYNWPQINTPGFAPEGWRIPTLDDWNTLITFAGGLTAGGKLKDGVGLFDDWFLPSRDELAAMYSNLKAFGVGGFSNSYYWSSSESAAVFAWAIDFTAGVQDPNSVKNAAWRVRASRRFTAGIGDYALRDTGPAGGLIFYISGTTYYEASPADISGGYVWSNVNGAVGGTGTAIGTGLNNTLLIIAQPGHTTSAAKLCNDYEIAGTLSDYWNAPNTGAINFNDFSMRGGGLYTSYVFVNKLIGGYYWTKTEANAVQAYSIRALYNSAALSTFNLAKNGYDYASVRLIKDV